MQTFINSIVLPIITAAGGAAVVAWISIQFFGEIIGKHLFNKALENYKTELSIKNHVSQYRFDREVESLSLILGDLYKVCLSTKNLRENIRNIRDAERNAAADKCFQDIKTYFDDYYQHTLYVNENLSQKFLRIVDELDLFQKVYYKADYHLDQMEQMAMDHVPASNSEYLRCQKLADEELKEMDRIIAEINSKGNELSYYDLVDTSRKYLDGLSII